MITITDINGYYDGPLSGEMVKDGALLYWEAALNDEGDGYRQWEEYVAWPLAEDEWEVIRRNNQDEALFLELLEIIEGIRTRPPLCRFRHEEAFWERVLQDY